MQVVKFVAMPWCEQGSTDNMPSSWKGCNDDDAVLSLNMFVFASVSSALHLELQFSGNKSGKHRIIQFQWNCLEQILSLVKSKLIRECYGKFP